MAEDRERSSTPLPAAHTKVTAAHLKRDAFLYVRQSTLHQVLQNTESTQRQYALQQLALALGWPIERVHVIDCDLGHSGASAVDREGFQALVTEVSLGRAGVVLGLEVSRLARLHLRQVQAQLRRLATPLGIVRPDGHADSGRGWPLRLQRFQ